MSYTRLLRVMANKEKTHYARVFGLLPKIHGIFGKAVSWPVIFVVITVFHYCFAFMHFMFESFLFLFKRSQYDMNMRTFGAKKQFA